VLLLLHVKMNVVVVGCYNNSNSSNNINDVRKRQLWFLEFQSQLRLGILSVALRKSKFPRTLTFKDPAKILLQLKTETICINSVLL
jgi:hypothetical protein